MKKGSQILYQLFGWGAYISIFAGAACFFGFVIALIIGGGTGAAMPAPTQPTEKPPVPEPFIYVLPGMPGILGFFTKSSLSGIMTGRSSRRISGKPLF